MGQVAHFVTWTGEELEVFWSSFFGSRFASSRSVGKSIQGDQPQHISDEKRLFAGLAGAGVDHFAPLPHGIECSFEADASERDIMAMRGLLHESANQIIDD